MLAKEIYCELTFKIISILKLAKKWEVEYVDYKMIAKNLIILFHCWASLNKKKNQAQTLLWKSTFFQLHSWSKSMQIFWKLLSLHVCEVNWKFLCTFYHENCFISFVSSVFHSTRDLVEPGVVKVVGRTKSMDLISHNFHFSIKCCGVLKNSRTHHYY